jgi:hypothetical protein
MSNPPTMPPADTPELTVNGGSANWRTNLAGQPLFPFWPLDISVLDIPPIDFGDDEDERDERVAAYHAAQTAAVAAHVRRREFNLSPEQAFFGAPIPDWWQTAILYTNRLAQQAREMPKVFEQTRASLDWARGGLAEAQAKSSAEGEKQASYVKMYEEKLAKLDRLQPAFEALAAEAEAWTKGRDPWAFMGPEDQAHLVEVSAKANPQFADLRRHTRPTASTSLRTPCSKPSPRRGTLPMRRCRNRYAKRSTKNAHPDRNGGNRRSTIATVCVWPGGSAYRWRPSTSGTRWSGIARSWTRCSPRASWPVCGGHCRAPARKPPGSRPASQLIKPSLQS